MKVDQHHVLLQLSNAAFTISGQARRPQHCCLVCQHITLVSTAKLDSMLRCGCFHYVGLNQSFSDSRHFHAYTLL